MEEGVYPLTMKWGKIVSNSWGIEVNNRMFRPEGPSSAVTLTQLKQLNKRPNILSLTSLPRELLTILPHFKFDDVAMSLYNIFN